MTHEDHNRVCPVERAGVLENPIRRIFQSPRRLLKPYIKEGMNVLDFGCGPGFFTIEIAKMLNGNGKVVAADLQDGMLDIVRGKIKGTDTEKIIQLHKCADDKIGVQGKFDFILAFYVVHEVPSQENLFAEFKSIINSGGKILIVEPNFHVTKSGFQDMLGRLSASGFQIISRRNRLGSRSVLAENNFKK